MTITFSTRDVETYENMRLALARVLMAETQYEVEGAYDETLRLIIDELERTNRRLRAIERALGEAHE